MVAWEPADDETSYNENIWELKTGFTSRVEMHLPVLLEGVHEGKLSLERLVQVACANPARIFGVYPKGPDRGRRRRRHRPGRPRREVTVSNEHVLTRSGWTVLDGHTIHGWTVATFLRGKQMSSWEDGAPGPSHRRRRGPLPSPDAGPRPVPVGVGAAEGS